MSYASQWKRTECIIIVWKINSSRSEERRVGKECGLSKAARPFNSRLDKSKLVENGFKPLPTWQDAVARYLKEIEF